MASTAGKRLIAAGKIKRDKPLAPIGEDEQPFGLRKGWEWVRIDGVAEVQGGIQKTPLRRPVKNHHPYLRVANVQRDAFKLDEIERYELTDEELARWTLIENDLLIVEGNGSEDEIGRCAVWTGQIAGCVYQNHLIRVRCLDAACVQFLKLFLNSPSGTDEMKRLAITTSGLYNLSVGKIRNFAFPLPPLPEQARIVTRVEELMRVCDALEATGQRQAAHQRQLVQTLLGDLTADSHTPWQRVAAHFDTLLDRPSAVDALEQTILQLAVRGQLVPQDPTDEPAGALLQRIRPEKDRLIAAGKIKRNKPLAPIGEEEKPFELPPGWAWVRCGDYFLELCTGPFGSMIHQEGYVTGGVPLINPSHMISGRIAHDPRVAINQKDAERLSAYALSAGDMVLARRGEVGRYALVTDQEDGWLCGTGSFFVRLHRACDRDYLGLVFTDGRFRQHLQGESVGSTMTNLNQRILLDALIALPPLPEQARIVARVTQLRRLCADLRQRLTQSQTTQAALAEALVVDAVSGVC